MSLRSLGLENFRGFSDSYIRTKPLTVMVGANSSGKSSFSHALAAMAHANRIFASSPNLSLTPSENPDQWPADLGYLADVRKADAKGSIYISIETDEGKVRWGFGTDILSDRDQPLDISFLSQPPAIHPPVGATPITIETNATTPIAVTGDGVAASGAVSVVEDLHRFTKINEQQWKDNLGHISVLDLRGLSANIATHTSGTAVVLNGPIREEIQKIFGNLTYLRAVRGRPSRSYPSRYRSPQNFVGYSGEGFAEVLHQRGKDKIRFVAPPIESTEVQNGHRFVRSEWHTRELSLAEALEAWLNHLGLASSVNASPHPLDPHLLRVRITIGRGEPHDISEVGFGLSQILPVLIAGLLQSPDGPFVVDLPEAHLHPRPQALAADFFCSMALGGKRCIVETHSEMFVNQLRLRAEMDSELRDKIAIYFLDEPDMGECSNPKLLGINEDEQLRWPRGFLEEAFYIEAKINDIRIARRSPNSEMHR